MSTFPIQRVAAFGDSTIFDGSSAVIEFEKASSANFCELNPENLRQHGITTIVVNTTDHELVDAHALTRCRLAGIRVLNDVEFREKKGRAVDIDRLKHGWLAYGGTLGGRGRRIFIRTFDIMLSLSILTVTLPVLLLMSFLIKFDSRGPVLYRQTRVGLLEEPFEIVKFRSMRVDAEKDGIPIWAAERDPRITRIGRFMRKFRIDELPQLLNVLRGDMSIIGPRPERPQLAEEISAHIPRFRDRNFVKPGITGWAQVRYPYGASIEDAKRKLAYDLYYIKHRSILLDFRICAETLRVVAFREGAR